MHRSTLLLRIVLAFSIALSPLAAARAAETSATAYLTKNSVAAVTVRLADAVKTEFVKSLPVEVLDAASQKYLGIPVADIDRITLIAEPPAGMVPLYAAVVSSTRPVSVDGIVYELTAHTEAGELDGKAFLESQQPMMPSILQLDEQTIAVGPKPMLRRLARGGDNSGAALAKAMTANGAETNHLHAALMLEPLRPLIQMGMSQAMNEAPPEAQKYFQIVNLIEGAVLAVDMSGERPSSLTAYANDASDADFLADLIDTGIEELRANTLQSPEMLEMAASSDPVQRAMAAYAERSFGEQAAALTPKRSGSKAFVLGQLTPGGGTETMAAVGVIGVLVALLLPAVQAAREAARRNQSMNNMKQIALALHNHHDTHGEFPPQAITDGDGKPLLSWRVAILPYIEEQALYNRFKLDEPWDSPNNLPLIAEMPSTFQDPSSVLPLIGGKTNYLAVAGPNAVFKGGAKGIQFRGISDGASRTIAAVQVNDQHAVEWTKPVDYDVVAHNANPVGGIGMLHPGIFLAAFCDGSVQAISLDIDAETLRAMFTRNGRENVNP